MIAGSLGCSTMRTAGHFPSGHPTRGGVEVRVFETSGAYHSGSVGPPRVTGVLERFQDGGWQRVFQALGPSWLVVDLASGRYRVRIPEVSDRRRHEARSSGWRRAFDVKAGAISRVEAILDDRSSARRVGVAVGLVALAAGVLALEDWDDEPDCPDPDALYESTTAADLALETMTDDRIVEEADPSTPILFSHFPEEGTVVAGDGLRIVVALSAPPGSIGRQAIVVRTADDEAIPGRIGFDRDKWWLTWSPSVALPPDAELQVTVSVPGATDWLGNDLTAAALFTFRTAEHDNGP